MCTLSKNIYLFTYLLILPTTTVQLRSFTYFFFFTNNNWASYQDYLFYQQQLSILSRLFILPTTIVQLWGFKVKKVFYLFIN